MNDPFRATFRYLVKTENEAAIEVLIAALESPHLASRREALRALLLRSSLAGHIAVLRRMGNLKDDIKAVLQEQPELLVPVVAKGLRESAPEDVPIACEAAISVRLYEAVPQMVAAMVKPGYAHTALVAGTVLRLTELLYAELVDDELSRRTYLEKIRQSVTSALEDAVRKFDRHQRKEVVEAMLLVVKPSNVTLQQIFSHPNDACHEAVRDVLLSSPQGGVIRLLLGLLDDPQSPRAALAMIGQRCDNKFLEHLLRRIGLRLSKTVAETLARIDNIAWAQPGHPAWSELSEEAQPSAVQLLMASGLPRQKVFEMIGYLLLFGEVAGRREAAKALAQFDQPEAAALLIKAINDSDPEVRAHLLVQMRPRNIPGAIKVLIRMTDSPHPQVRAALRTALPEFTVRRFLATFKAMSEEDRMAAGDLVRKIDDNAIAELTKELKARSPVRRRRAVLVAKATGLVQELEQLIVDLLADEDHPLRVAAAQVLADCKSQPSWQALQDAMFDRSFLVREAAEQSLTRITSSLSADTSEESDLEEITT
jgi:HEAT repeat protein